MKAFIKTHSAAISGGLCLLIILCTALSLFARSGDGKYKLADLSGDEALFASLTLPMELGDGTHTQELLLQNGVLTHKFRKRKILSSETIISGSVYSRLVPAPDSVSVFEDYTYKDGMKKGTATPSLKRSVDKAAQVLDISYRKDYTGLNEYLYGAKFESVTVLTEIKYDAKPTEFVYVHEDESVDGMLCLLLIENGELTLKIYTLEGELLRKTEMGNYAVKSKPWTELSVTRDGASILCYRLDPQNVYDAAQNVDEAEASLYALDLQTGALLSSLADEWHCFDFGFAQGRWLLSTQGVPRIQSASISAYDARFLVLGAKGEALCSFDIFTDAWQDQLSYAQSSLDWGRTGYELQKYRSLHADMGALSWRS